MTLNLSLVIGGEQTGARKAIQDTATDIQDLGGKAREAAKPIADMGSGLDEMAKSGPKAAESVKNIGEAAAASGQKIVSMKEVALGSIGGLAGGIIALGIDLVFGTLANAASNYFQELTSGPGNVKGRSRSPSRSRIAGEGPMVGREGRCLRLWLGFGSNAEGPGARKRQSAR